MGGAPEGRTGPSPHQAKDLLLRTFVGVGTVGRRVAAVLELHCGEASIEAVRLRLQLVMGAGFHHATAGDHDDLVGGAHGGKAVCDDEAGAACHQGFKSGLNEAFTFRVQGTGCLVQQQDRGIFEDGAGNGDSLALSSGQSCSAFPDHRVVSFGKSPDELVGIGGTGCGDDLLQRGAWAAVGDVFANGAAEEEDFLGDKGHLVAKPGQWVIEGVAAIDSEHPRGGLVES